MLSITKTCNYYAAHEPEFLCQQQELEEAYQRRWVHHEQHLAGRSLLRKLVLAGLVS